MEVWQNLAAEGLDNYSVSNTGQIRNDRTNRLLKQSPNQSGTYKVGMVRHTGEPPITLGVAPLVARYFVEGETREFDTPINLDGNRANNSAENLAWRPRWFAINYHRQFNFAPIVFKYPIVCLDFDQVFESCRHAAIHFGLLERAIAESIVTQRGVWPLGYDFRLFKE